MAVELVDDVSRHRNGKAVTREQDKNTLDFAKVCLLIAVLTYGERFRSGSAISEPQVFFMF